jgi:hypothetical protein
MMTTHMVARRIRIFLLFEAATFFVAALTHLGVLVNGYEHREARIAESVIALVLLAGLALSGIRPAWTRKAGVASRPGAFVIRDAHRCVYYRCWCRSANSARHHFPRWYCGGADLGCDLRCSSACR